MPGRFSIIGGTCPGAPQSLRLWLINYVSKMGKKMAWDSLAIFDKEVKSILYKLTWMFWEWRNPDSSE